jgi:hypothetical protein
VFGGILTLLGARKRVYARPSGRESILYGVSKPYGVSPYAVRARRAAETYGVNQPLRRVGITANA